MNAGETRADARVLVWWMAVVFAVTFGAIMRFDGLSANPPGMFRDELEKGYTALEIARTGRHGVLHETGVSRTGPVPLFIDVFGDKTSAIYQYLSAPIVGIGGLSRGTTRAVAALAGVAAILAAAWLGYLWGARSGSAVAALATAAMPASVVFSRWAQQGSLVPPLVLCGIALAWLGLWREGRERRTLAVLGGLLLGLAFYAYDPVRPGVALLAAALVAGLGPQRLRTQWRLAAWFAAAFLALSVPVFLYAIGPEGSYRFGRVSVFREGLVPGLRAAGSNYAAHFSPFFLFLTGDSNPRHHLPDSGFAALAHAPLAMLGVYAALRRLLVGDGPEARARGIALVVLLAAAPLGAAFTRDGIPHALRSILLVPALAMACAEGMHLLHHRGKLPRWLSAGVVVVLVGHSVEECKRGVRALAEANPNAWQAGVLEALDRAWRLRPEGPVYLASEIPYAPYFALFHEQPEPRAFQESGLLALRTRILAPGSPASSIPENAVLVAPMPEFASYSRHDHAPAVLMVRESTPEGAMFGILPGE